jgi:hypothetical protein
MVLESEDEQDGVERVGWTNILQVIHNVKEELRLLKLITAFVDGFPNDQIFRDLRPHLLPTSGH